MANNVKDTVEIGRCSYKQLENTVLQLVQCLFIDFPRYRLIELLGKNMYLLHSKVSWQITQVCCVSFKC